MQQISNFLDDFRLATQPRSTLHVDQKTDLENSLLLRVVGVALGALAAFCFVSALSILPWSAFSGAILLLVGSAAGIAAHDFICWGNNLRDITLHKEVLENNSIYENLSNMVHGATMLFREIATGVPYELHDTWVIRYIWKWQNPNVL